MAVSGPVFLCVTPSNAAFSGPSRERRRVSTHVRETPLKTRPTPQTSSVQRSWHLEISPHSEFSSPLHHARGSSDSGCSSELEATDCSVYKQNTSVTSSVRHATLRKWKLCGSLYQQNAWKDGLRACATFTPAEVPPVPRDPSESDRKGDVNPQTTLVPNSSAFHSRGVVQRAGSTSSVYLVPLTLTSFFFPLFLFLENPPGRSFFSLQKLRGGILLSEERHHSSFTGLERMLSDAQRPIKRMSQLCTSVDSFVPWMLLVLILVLLST